MATFASVSPPGFWTAFLIAVQSFASSTKEEAKEGLLVVHSVRLLLFKYYILQQN